MADIPSRVVGDTVMVSAAYRLGAALLKVQPDGTSYDVVWRSPTNLLTHWSTAIALHVEPAPLSSTDARAGVAVSMVATQTTREAAAANRDARRKGGASLREMIIRIGLARSPRCVRLEDC